MGKKGTKQKRAYNRKPVVKETEPVKELEPKKVYVPVRKNFGMGLFGNIYSYGNAGKYANRFYTLQDNAQGIDTYSRELLVRWSREMAAQLPVVSTATKIISQFTIDDAYLPEYRGKNAEWGKKATEWLTKVWYPNCCTRGRAYSFQRSLGLIVESLLTDGDLLMVYGQDKYGFPLFQIIPTNRIKSPNADTIISEGQYKDHLFNDGIIYTKQGQAVAYCVENSGNMVTTDGGKTENIIFGINDARLIFDAKYFDKNRGIPAIAPAILQAISIQELDRYEMDKAKIQSMIAYIEKNASGEAPQELQDTLAALEAQIGTTGNPYMIGPNDHALGVVNGPEIRYVRAEGGDIKPFASTGPNNDAADYMTRLETQVLNTLGVPHQLVFSTTEAGGNITHALAEIFRKNVKHYQSIIDETARFTVGWALAKAMDEGLLERNDEENMVDPDVFNFSHPAPFTLDAKYSNEIISDNYNNGFSTLNDVTLQLSNKTSSEVVKEQADEQINFYKEAKRVSDETGIDINIVIANWKNSSLKTTNSIQTQTEETKNEK